MQTTTLSGVFATQNVPVSIAAIGGFVAPAGGCTISHVIIANTTGAAGSPITVIVTLYNGTTDYYLVKQATIAPGDSLNVLQDSRVVLASGWSIRCSCNTANSADVTMSVVSYS